ncbi:hypothetical protein ACSSS7_000530 [Eimeria intestinalis]
MAAASYNFEACSLPSLLSRLPLRAAQVQVSGDLANPHRQSKFAQQQQLQQKQLQQQGSVAALRGVPAAAKRLH